MADKPKAIREDLFWPKVAKSDGEGCWQWIAAKNSKGYGNFQSRSAHVVAFELANGKIPPGMEIDHLCRNRACVNPAHLEAVTPTENKRRHKETITHCKWGHLLSPDNVLIKHRWDGERRVCRNCFNRLRREKRARDRAEKANA